MINFYSFYSKIGLDKEEYAPLLDQLDEDEYTKELEPIAHILKRDSWYAYRYAKDIIRGRWPEAEPYIIKDSWYAFMYAQYVIRGRWEEAESVIIKEPRGAWLYAWYILKSRWVEAEPYIKEDDYWWGQYCRHFKLL
jgi:hypothetical protein